MRSTQRKALLTLQGTIVLPTHCRRRKHASYWVRRLCIGWSSTETQGGEKTLSRITDFFRLWNQIYVQMTYSSILTRKWQDLIHYQRSNLYFSDITNPSLGRIFSLPTLLPLCSMDFITFLLYFYCIFLLTEPTVIRMFTKRWKTLTRKDTRELENEKKNRRKREEIKGTYCTICSPPNALGNRPSLIRTHCMY